jgi:hypothetical protein
MAQTITIDGVSRTGAVPRESIELAESAYLGEVAEGKLMVRDTAGTISVVGHKTIVVAQSASTPTRVATQFVGPKSIKTRNAPFGAGREIELTTRDLNSLLKRKIIEGDGAAGGNRPAETITVRVAWLLATFLSGLVADFGRVQPSTVALDKDDCRSRFPGDVLAALARSAKFNEYVRYNEGEDAYELVFRDENQDSDDTYLALTDSATIRISNDPTDAIDHVTVFAPLGDATDFAEDPDDVYAGAYGAYGTGHVYVERAATAAAFVDRDGTTEDSGIKTAEAATIAAETFLDESDAEEQAIDVTLRMREAQVNLAMPGFRIQTKMIHLAPEGWASGNGRWARIARRRVSQPLKTDFDYNVALHLLPQEAPPAAVNCSDTWTDTPAGTYYPLGSPTGSSPANPSDGVIYYFRGGLGDPTTPDDIGYIGEWNFGVFGPGGAGTIDYAGTCVQNILILMTVGNGTWTIQTERYGGLVKPLWVNMGPAGFASPSELVATIASGDSVEVVIDDTSAGDCIRWVKIRDTGGACGGKWGFSQGVWA